MCAWRCTLVAATKRKPRPPPQDRASADVAKRDEKGRFGVGNQANPGGQPAWVKAIRERLSVAADEGAALCLSVIRGEPTRLVVEGVEGEVVPEVADRLRAVEIALRYSVPVPKLEVEVSSPSPALERLRQASTEALIAALDAVEKPRES